MLDALKQSIRNLHLAHWASLEDECDALLIRIEQARRTGVVTDEQAMHLVYDVRNERSRCFRSVNRCRIKGSASS
ncbi:hypothetical protein [Pseudomonas syringae]|uniref:hypothetical protein n=1 Tax=Pseudomonas syringae TaxID=317 RepID=UPI0011D22AA9|nr:hypothetical protein [Pseudomonas syringae]